MKLKDEDKQQAIAAATFRLVEQSGLSGLTMAAIAREAGIATGTLYVYHRSKEELLGALYQQAKSATIAQVMQGHDPAAPLRTRFRRFWLNLVRHRIARYAEAVFQEQFYNSPWFGEAERQLSLRFVADWHAMYEEGKAQFILKNLPTPLLVANFMGSVRETSNLVRNGELPGTESTFDQAFTICWDGMKA